MRARELSSSSSLASLGHAEGLFTTEKTSSFATPDPLKKNNGCSSSSSYFSVSKANCYPTRDEKIAAMSSSVMIDLTSDRTIGMNSHVPFSEEGKYVTAGVKAAVRLVTTVVALSLAWSSSSSL